MARTHRQLLPWIVMVIKINVKVLVTIRRR